jgi:hypothetical protein
LRGIGAVVVGAGPAHAFYFSTYEFTKEKLTEMKINDNVNYSEFCHHQWIMKCQQSTLLPILFASETKHSNQIFYQFFSYERNISDLDPRRHFQSNRSNQTATSNVWFTLQIGRRVCKKSFSTGRHFGVLSLLHDTACDESALPSHTLLDVWVLSRDGEFWLLILSRDKKFKIKIRDKIRVQIPQKSL